MQVEVKPISYEDMKETVKGEDSKTVRERVERARGYQKARFEGTGIMTNADIPDRDVEKYCQLSPSSQSFWTWRTKNINSADGPYIKC